nr:heme-binding domain-containing protein [Lutibacter sp.]
KVMESHEMPLKSYLLLHENAKMNKNQYEAFSKWLSTIEIQ